VRQPRRVSVSRLMAANLNVPAESKTLRPLWTTGGPGTLPALVFITGGCGVSQSSRSHPAAEIAPAVYQQSHRQQAISLLPRRSRRGRGEFRTETKHVFKYLVDRTLADHAANSGRSWSRKSYWHHSIRGSGRRRRTPSISRARRRRRTSALISSQRRSVSLPTRRNHALPRDPQHVEPVPHV
jgi:hypothetical protein